jgi:hypothetical protein
VTIGALLLALTVAVAPGERLAPVVGDGVPRGVVTMVVPVPAELREAAEVLYAVRVTGSVEVLGRLVGTARAPGLPDRPLLLTMRIPAGAEAGIVEAAEVAFRTPRGTEYIVPLQLRVSVVRALSLLGAPEMRGLRAGDRLELEYRIVNAGNAPDTAWIGVQAPPGWIARLERTQTAIVPPRGQLEFRVTLGIPLATNVGDHTIAVSLRKAMGTPPVATVFTTLGLTGRAGSTPGLVVKPSVAVASGADGTVSASAVDVEGPVGDGVTLRARLAPPIEGRGMAVQGLSSVGATSAPFSASLAGADWDVTVGNTAAQLTELAGVNLIGQGLTARQARADHEWRLIAARPGFGDATGGRLLGAAYWRQTGIGRLGGAASRLAETGDAIRGRDLTALVLDYRTDPIGTVTIGASVAHRASAAAEGTGAAGSFTHEGRRERVSLRVAHAPGGSAAYARAVDEWQLDASRLLTRDWSVDAFVQRTRDAGPFLQRMDVLAWSLGQRLTLGEATAATLRAQRSSFDARTSAAGIGGFGAADRRLVGGLEWRRERIHLTAEGSYGELARATQLVDGSLASSAARQRGMRLGASRGFLTLGMLDAHASLEETAAGVGMPARVLGAGLRWSELPVSVGTWQARLEFESTLQRLGDLAPAVVSRVRVRAPLPFGLDLVVAGERNPFFRDARGRAGWIAAMRITAAARVYSPQSLGPEGMVYEDADQNGRRDPGERGVAGVVVRRGEAKATTDGEGRYRLPATARGRTRIEQGSLPIGLIAHPLLASDSLERLDLPVLPTGHAVLELELLPDANGRRPAVDLEPAIVILRDASGFEWVGRRTSATTAVFEGIPTGAYVVDANLSRIAEPLRIAESLVVVVSPHGTATLRVPLQGRAVRFFTPPARGTRSGSQP